MANDLLAAAIREARLDADEIADLCGVDPKTVGRWLSGRVPHARHRHKLADRLGVRDDELWPQTRHVRGREGLVEITGAWARRDGPDAPDWRALLRAAVTQVDLVGYSLHQILTANGAVAALAAKAGGGVPVRIAVADPDSELVLDAEVLQRQPGRLRARIRASHQQLAQLAATPGVEIRAHQVAASHTILRFDDQLLLTIHLAGTPGIQAPLLRVRRERDYGIFDQLAGHLETVWQTAQPLHTIASQPTAAAEQPAPAARTGADQLLDTLDQVWRPGS